MNGSSHRTGAEIEVMRGNISERTVMVAPNETAIEISSLLPLTSYELTIYVVTSVGRSRPSSVNASTLSLRLEQPTILNITTISTSSLQLTWEHPVMRPLTTSPPTVWVIELYLLDEVLIQNGTVNNPSSNSTLLTGLSAGVVYRIRVAGVNTRGVGNFSDFSIAQTFRVPNTTSEDSFMIKLHPGMAVELSCVSTGVPQPSISWFRNDLIITSDADDVSIMDTSNASELTVTDMMGEQGGEYNCSGTNVAGVSSLAFIVEYYPERVSNLSVDLITTSTISFSWVYQMNGSSPRSGVDIEISLDEILINSTTKGPLETMYTASSLLPLTEYNITVYVVTSVGRSLPATTEANTLSLRLPRPYINFSRPVSTMELQVIWQIPHINLNTTTPPTSWITEIYLENGTFVQNVTINDPNITSVTIMDLTPGTIYEIQVAGINTRGVGNFSNLVSQQTFQVPTITSESSSMKLFPYTNISISCDFSGIPQPTPSWTQDNRNLSVSGNNISILNTFNTTEIIVLDVMGTSGGEYTCTATNLVGKASVNFTIEFFAEEVENIVVLSVSINEISIAWEYQMNGSRPRIHAEIDIRRANILERTIVVEPEETTATISSLNPLSLYTITLYVITNVGRSRPSVAMVSTLSLKIPEPNIIQTSMINTSEVLVMWEHPVVSNVTTTPVESWVIEVYQEMNLEQRLFLNESNTDRITLVKLKNGTTYFVQIAGINTRGIGNFSELIPIYLTGITNVHVALIDDTSVILHWMSTAIMDQKIEIDIVSIDVGVRTIAVGYNETTVAITSLKPLTNYTFSVYVAVDIGRSLPFTISAMTLSSRLLQPYIESFIPQSNSEILLEWRHPVVVISEMDPPIAWKINLTTVCGDPVQDFIINSSDVSMIKLQNLTSNTAYTVRVSGINSRGVGSASEFATAQTRNIRDSTVQVSLSPFERLDSYVPYVIGSTFLLLSAIGIIGVLVIVRQIFSSGSIKPQDKGHYGQPGIDQVDNQIVTEEAHQLFVHPNFTGTPTPTVTWFRNGKKLKSSKACDVKSDGSLYLPCVSMKQAGRYNCRVENKLGAAEGYIILHVKPSNNTELPMN